MDAEDDPLDIGELTVGFERWRMVVPAGTERPTRPDDWADALVIVEHGAIEVVCRDGARQTFGTGSLLALSWVTVECLRNPGPFDTVIAAVRRRPRPDARREVPYPA
jgi:hypothetical protein